MSEYEKEELVKRISGMSEEEQRIAAGALKSEIMFDELARRTVLLEQKLENVVGALKDE